MAEIHLDSCLLVAIRMRSQYSSCMISKTCSLYQRIPHRRQATTLIDFNFFCHLICNLIMSLRHILNLLHLSGHSVHHH